MSGGTVIVVGAGVFGAWTAHHLHKAGEKVVLLDAYGPAHSRASSGDESRIIRAAYGRDEIYSRMARDSLAQWQWLDAISSLPVFVRTGVLFFFAADDRYAHDSLATHEHLGLPTELLTQKQLARRYPIFDFDEIELGLFEPDFGALMARRAVLTLVDRFVRDGGTYRLGSVAPPMASSDRLTEVLLAGGERLAADRFIFAAGAWLPAIFPEAIGRRIVATRQELFYFAPPPGDERFGVRAMPVWADFNYGDMFYGVPDLESRGVKFAHDAHGPVIDPDTQDRQPTQAALDEVIAFRDRRFPLLRGAPLTESRVCQYENSSNGDFLIDFHPQFENALLVGGGSGHGFKHGPEVGRYATERLLGTARPEPRFSLATKSEAHRREVH